MTEPCYPLWQGAAPGALGTKPEDIPTVTVFEPDNELKNGAAMIVFPGGGYTALMDYEGEAYARWLAGHGYTCFVAQYRLTPNEYRLPVIFDDGARAVRWVRAHATEYGIGPRRIGIIGSSAGGHLSALLAVHFDAGRADAPDPVDRQSSRPDAVVLCYPAIHLPSWEKNLDTLLGKDYTKELRLHYCAELHVRRDSPPCFLFHTFEDPLVPVNQSMLFAEALRDKNVPFELHVYQKGGHGLALGNGHPWTAECARWLGAVL
jgi:acetyl esterase/lipase